MKWLKLFPLFLICSCVTSQTLNSDEIFIFTQDVRERLENNAVPLQKVQFYLNNTIILERTVSSDSAAVTSGKVILENGIYKQRIVIPKNTPGIFSNSKTKNTILVSFEAGNQLNFSSSGNSNGEYSFMPNPVKGKNSVFYENNIYEVRLGRVRKSVERQGNGYRVASSQPGARKGNSSYLYYNLVDDVREIKLALRKSEFEEFDLKTRVVDGLRIEDNSN